METTIPETLAEKTLQRLGAAMSSPQASSFPEIIRLVHTLSQKQNNITVGELAALVEKDAKLLVKVLQIANSIAYNIGKTKITTVTQAIQRVGFNCVCSIAMATMLLEQSINQGSEEQKEAASLALCAGTFAKIVQHDDVDSDLAFICASLRHFGRIAVATTMPTEFAEARGLMAVMTEDQAFEKVFGLSGKDLSAALLKQGKVPEEISSIIGGESGAPVAAISEFAARLSSLVCNQRISAPEFAAQSARLSTAFAKTIPGVDEQLKSIISRAGQELQDLKKSFGVTSLPAIFVERLKSRASNKEPVDLTRTAVEATAAVTDKPASRPPAPAVAMPAAPKVSPKKDREMELLQAVLEDTRGLIKGNAGADEVCGALMDAMQSVFAATESCLFMGESGSLKIVQGAGRAWRKLKPDAVVSRDEKTVFGVCLQRNTIVLIHDVVTAQHIPPWLKAANLVGAFAALPINGMKQHAVILVGWPHSQKIVQTTEQSELIRQILSETANYVGK